MSKSLALKSCAADVSGSRKSERAAPVKLVLPSSRLVGADRSDESELCSSGASAVDTSDDDDDPHEDPMPSAVAPPLADARVSRYQQFGPWKLSEL